MIIGLLTLVVFVLWEWKGAKSPVVPFRLFKGQRVVGFVFIIAFVAGINYTFAQSLGATLLQEVFQPSPIRVGVYAMGPTAGLIVGATLFNVLLAYFGGHAREVLFVSAATMSELFSKNQGGQHIDGAQQLLSSVGLLFCRRSTQRLTLS